MKDVDTAARPERPGVQRPAARLQPATTAARLQRPAATSGVRPDAAGTSGVRPDAAGTLGVRPDAAGTDVRPAAGDHAGRPLPRAGERPALAAGHRARERRPPGRC